MFVGVTGVGFAVVVGAAVGLVVGVAVFGAGVRAVFGELVGEAAAGPLAPREMTSPELLDLGVVDLKLSNMMIPRTVPRVPAMARFTTKAPFS